MIRREDVADLRGGDVVELHRQGWADDVVVRGTLRGDSCAGELYIGDYSIFSENGNEPDWLTFPGTTLTVVSRAPRPLYVNSDRTEPVPGDVVRDEMTGDVFVREHNTVLRPDPFWWCPVRGRSRRDDCINLPLTLLIDAETGEVVP